MNNFVITHIFGFCPVQAEGFVNGDPFYFRARGQEWSFAIDTFGDDPVGVMMGNKGFFLSESWGDKPFAAGYMSTEEAERIIKMCADRYMEGAAL